jgi:hypothetical protein
MTAGKMPFRRQGGLVVVSTVKTLRLASRDGLGMNAVKALRRREISATVHPAAHRETPRGVDMDRTTAPTVRPGAIRVTIARMHPRANADSVVAICRETPDEDRRRDGERMTTVARAATTGTRRDTDVVGLGAPADRRVMTEAAMVSGRAAEADRRAIKIVRSIAGMARRGETNVKATGAPIVRAEQAGMSGAARGVTIHGRVVAVAKAVTIHGRVVAAAKAVTIHGRVVAAARAVTIHDQVVAAARAVTIHGRVVAVAKAVTIHGRVVAVAKAVTIHGRAADHTMIGVAALVDAGARTNPK